MTESQKLNYRFHNPNTSDAISDFLICLFIEANLPKVERRMKNAVFDNEHKQAS